MRSKSVKNVSNKMHFRIESSKSENPVKGAIQMHILFYDLQDINNQLMKCDPELMCVFV